MLLICFFSQCQILWPDRVWEMSLSCHNLRLTWVVVHQSSNARITASMWQNHNLILWSSENSTIFYILRFIIPQTHTCMDACMHTHNQSYKHTQNLNISFNVLCFSFDQHSREFEISLVCLNLVPLVLITRVYFFHNLLTII